ncbi:NHLP bacteriocin export ABC transporter permease/ATPase subunit [Kamptonema animale CS-326]|jgi:NHLM bacteriocin system ABC transporter ATP-binding protein|uniref:NHLP bacteriocin export ABC transporter permease/ATPase subunit n=1 Tax=Kamptonema animale TaxID=92934 RepID=UPI00232DCD4D|nr:NHLP bacteriocin export ABC transporter permease/ATPase subunit [Kamptonema animale]MDB9513476.1 NHLP bacteriocin export ABC transporter permease/ATPase subunit [Kamptonema animale CS-326]
MGINNDLTTAQASQKVVKGNDPLVLDNSNIVWLIQSGTLAIFAVTVVDKVPTGARRYLFSVCAGNALFGVVKAGETPYQIIAVAVEEATLIESSMTEIVQLAESEVDDKREACRQLLDTWNTHLTSVFAGTNIPFKPNDTLKDRVQIAPFLHQLHSDFLYHLEQLENQEINAKFALFQERQRLNQQSTQGAITKLVSILKPKTVEFFQEGTPLLIAAGAVGRAMGIEIRPPARSENLERLKNPLEAIARSSRIRYRRVLLEDRWWRQDCGAILGYMEADKRPVALLPVPGGKYEVFDPTQQQRLPLTSEILEELDPVAYTFYRPFPEQTLNSLEIIKFATKGLQRDIAILILAGVIATLLGMVIPQATAILVDNAIPDADRGLLWQIGLALLATSFGKTIFELAEGFVTLRTQSLSNSALQTAFWDRLLKLRVSFFRQYSTGDLQSRVSAITQIRQILTGSVLGTLFHSFFSLLNLGLLFVYSSSLAFIAVGVGILSVMVTLISGLLTQRKMRPLQELEGEIFGLTVELIGGVSKLRVAGAENRAFAYWTRKYTEQLQLMLSTEVLEDIVAIFNTVLPILSSMLLYFLAVNLIVQGKGTLSTGTFLAFNSAFAIFITGTTSLSNTIIKILEITVLWERAKPILEAEPEIDLNKTDPGRLNGGVKLDRVTFRYRPDGMLTLDQVTVEAKAGEFIALVGPSGSGKSTIIRLLLGFETPEDGTIYYDGQDLDGLDISAIRRQLGVVLQNGRINSASMFENISGGALVTMDEAWTAAKMAGLGEDIENMPMGMHTVISEGGTNLSGGQRQRLLIARSLVLKPKILIFDEATSALDNRTQAIVSASLEQLDVTRIVVAHRLTTIRNADCIYVIEAGQVVQSGKFEELIEQPGLFAQLMARQMA